MNFLAHALVAETVSGTGPAGEGRADPLFVLGAVLPDLASVAGVRLDRSRLTGRVAVGARCHVLADAAFHACRPFRLGAASIRQEVAAEGLSRGSARAIGHIGWELLLDGALLGTPAEQSFRAALGAPGAGEATSRAISPPERQRWSEFVARRHRWPPLRYDDPAWVAERLAALLGNRPRLGFSRDRVGAVAGVLARHAPAIRAVAGEVVAATAAATGDRLASTGPAVRHHYDCRPCWPDT